MTALRRNALYASVLSFVAASAQAQSAWIDSVVVKTRELDDVAAATVVWGGTYPDSLAFVEVGVSAPSGFANRDVWRFSADGVTPYSFGIDEFFRVSMEVTLAGLPTTPRKEAGFLLSSIAGDGQFMVNTDAHEVVAFGGPFPFYAFPATYDSGETIRLGMTYFLNPATGKRAIVYSADGVDSPVLEFANLEQGILEGSTLGGYFQIVNDPANTSNTAFVLFNRIEVVPEPSTLALLAFGLLPFYRRQRS